MLKKRPTHVLNRSADCDQEHAVVAMQSMGFNQHRHCTDHPYGSPIAPDCGGTAHAYCGTALPATLGDLLPWLNKPTLEDMRRGYIIRSRVKEADKIILAQPYSPYLFRQGLLPGPNLLVGRSPEESKLRRGGEILVKP